MPEEPVASILIVDDDEDTTDLLEKGVSVMGDFRISTVHSGREAMEIMEKKLAENDPPDLVLLDIMMADMDGTEVCRALKKDTRTSHIPVVAITVIHRGERGRWKKIMECGFDGYLEKPFSFSDLKKIIVKILDIQDTGVF